MRIHAASLFRRLAIGAVLALAQTGCLSVASIAVETLDENVSIARDENCKTGHLLFGKSYCQSRRRPQEVAPLYCFQTLGGIDCHATPDPYAMTIPGRVMPPLAVGAPAPMASVASTAGPASAPPTPDAAVAAQWAGTPIPEADRPAAAMDLRPTHRTWPSLNQH